MLTEILKDRNAPTGRGGGGSSNPRIVILLGLVNPEVDIATVPRNICRYLALQKGVTSTFLDQQQQHCFEKFKSHNLMLFSLLPFVLPRDLLLSGLLTKCNISLTPLSTLHNPHPTNLITLIIFRKVTANLSQYWTHQHVKDAQVRKKVNIKGVFISILDGDECLASRPAVLPLGKWHHGTQWTDGFRSPKWGCVV
jgi:hypothetical protein